MTLKREGKKNPSNEMGDLYIELMFDVRIDDVELFFCPLLSTKDAHMEHERKKTFFCNIKMIDLS